MWMGKSNLPSCFYASFTEREFAVGGGGGPGDDRLNKRLLTRNPPLQILTSSYVIVYTLHGIFMAKDLCPLPPL